MQMLPVLIPKVHFIVIAPQVTLAMAPLVQVCSQTRLKFILFLFFGVNFFKDIDECKQGNNCSTHASCTDTEGSYYCNCSTGYFGNGKDCYSMVIQLYFKQEITSF